MFTVKQVSALTGVAEPTLRVWERRYDIVRPERSSGGYRLYDDAQVATLREMAALVESGVPASRAAATVRELASAFPSGGVGTADLPGADEFVAAALSLEPAVLDDILRRALASGPFEEVADEWILPALVRLGEAWEAGEVTVAHEHFASSGVMRAVSAVFDGSTVPPEGPVVLVGLAEGDRHQLALLCFATCLRRRGVDVIYLGADIPTGEWVAAAARRRARAAVVGVTSGDGIPAAQELIDALGSVVPPLSLWVGGSQSEEISGAHRLPSGVGEAASRLHLGLVAGSV